MIEYKSAEISRMAVTGQFVGELLAELSGVAAVGVNLIDLEHHARRRIKERGAESCYWDYAPSFGRGPFRNVLCLSVNDAVLHGLPHDYVLRDGDLLSIDMAAGIDGWVADSALSVIVGARRPGRPEADRGHQGRTGGRRAPAAQPGGRLGDISAAIGEVAHSCAGVNAEFGGHGIGRTMHEAPHISTTATPAAGMKNSDPASPVRHGPLVLPLHRQNQVRQRRLDDPLRRRLPHRALRTHSRHHGFRPPGPDPPPHSRHHLGRSHQKARHSLLTHCPP